MEQILIVEDSRLVRSMLAEALQRDEISILEAATFSDAQRHVEETEEPIFVALLDLVLPDATHGEVVKWITDRGIPAIVFTSEFNEEIRRTLIRAGVVDYIVKRDRLAIAQVTRVVANLRRNRRFSVLAVDDSATMRHFFENTLRSYCFDVHLATNGVEALNVIEAHPEIRLVITDYMMPEMDGFELVRALRRKFEPGRLSIIGTASRGNAMLATRFLKEGADDFLPKPFWNEEFYARISQNIEILDRIDRLETLNKTKNRFLGMAAHDLRSPLGGIINAIELFNTGYLGEVTDEQHEFLSSMKRNASGMFSLINDLLDVSAIEAGSITLNYEGLDVVTIVTEQMMILRPGADRKGVALHLDAPDEPVTLVADRRAVEQIVANVLSNAIKYTHKNTTVTVTVRTDEHAVELQMRDRGNGIPEAEQTRLFTPFSKISTTPTAGETSHGLGLAIVKRLVDAHNGTIRVDSGREGGTNVTVELPHYAT